MEGVEMKKILLSLYHFIEGDNSQQGREIISDLYVLWFVGYFYGSLGHHHMPTWCLRIWDDIWELSLGSASRGSTLIWRYLLNQNRKKNVSSSLDGEANMTDSTKEGKAGGPNAYLLKRLQGLLTHNTLYWGCCLALRVRRERWLEPVPGYPPPNLQS